jgi:hypothetical protein
MRSAEPLGTLPHNGEPFYFDDGGEEGLKDYVYEDGMSLTCMDYRDAVAVMRGKRPGDFERENW